MGTITAKDVTITAIMPNGERITINPYDTSSDSTNIAIDMIVRNNLYLREQRDQLAEALYVALPFVEDWELAEDNGYKNGVIEKTLKTIRAALAAIEEE